MAFDRTQKIQHGAVFAVSEERVVPRPYDDFIHDCLDAREVSDHPEFGVAVGRDDCAADRHLDGIAMAVQMPALTVVIRNTMAGVEFEPAGDAHVGSGAAEERAIISPRILRPAATRRVYREVRPLL